MSWIQFLGGASLGWKAIKYVASHSARQKAKIDRERAEKREHKSRLYFAKVHSTTQGAKRQLALKEKELSAAELKIRQLRVEVAGAESHLIRAESDEEVATTAMLQAIENLKQAKAAETEVNKG